MYLATEGSTLTLMQASFLPSKVKHLRTPAAIALLESIKRVAIATPLLPHPIVTAYFHQGKGGTPILLIHGFDSSLLEFFRLLPLLAEKNETWAVDLCGFGFSDRPVDVNFSPAALKTHLYCFWKTLIDKPVILVGASMGGATAIDFTLTYPQAVKKLVLVNSVGYSGSFPIGRFLFPPFDYLAIEWWRYLKMQTLASALWETDPDPAYLDALLCTTLPLEMPRWYDATLAFTKSGGYSLSGEQIAQIKKPTLILWGKNDTMLDIADAEKFRRAIVNSQLIWIEKAGHAPQFDRPAILAEHILAFRGLTEVTL